MAHDIIAIGQRLTEEGLLGAPALRYGSPDRTMLVSAGPPSHLARWSLLSGPTTQRVTVRQPSRGMILAVKLLRYVTAPIR